VWCANSETVDLLHAYLHLYPTSFSWGFPIVEAIDYSVLSCFSYGCISPLRSKHQSRISVLRVYVVVAFAHSPGAFYVLWSAPFWIFPFTFTLHQTTFWCVVLLNLLYCYVFAFRLLGKPGNPKQAMQSFHRRVYLSDTFRLVLSATIVSSYTWTFWVCTAHRFITNPFVIPNIKIMLQRNAKV